MAGDAGQPITRVIDTLVARGPHFSFVQAMWLLRRAVPDGIEPGRDGPPADEFVRLVPSASLAFPPGEIESCEVDSARDVSLRLTTTFLGLYGAHSPLPNYYSEIVLRESDDETERPVRDFFDIFNHRFLSHLSRGLIKYRGHMLFRGDGRDEHSWRLFALGGMNADPAIAASGLSRARLLRLVGLMSHAPRSAAALTAVLRTLLGATVVRVQQCLARWVYLGDSQRSRLGQAGCRLGDDATIGDRVRDCSGGVRVAIGPVSYEQYTAFLPGGALMDSVRKLVRLIAGDGLAFDVQVTLDGGDTGRLAVRLGDDSRLGWTTGLFSAPQNDLPVVFG